MNITIAAALTSAFVVMAAGATFSANAQGRGLADATQTWPAATCETQIWPAYGKGCVMTFSGKPSDSTVRVVAQF
jgi:hypothetical protein